jgi:glycosyltransferase involved in cell wall biosynthesis
MTINKNIKICYFGAYDLDLPRNKAYIAGLRQNGARVIECFDHSPGLIKYYKLFIKHRKIRNKYNVMIVGYPGPLMVPFVKLISRKPIIFNAVTSVYEAIIVSRKKHSKHSFMAWRIWLIDWLAFKFADLVLVETNKQKDYLVKKFRIKSNRFVRLFTGVDDTIFYPDTNIRKSDKFTVLFRGSFLPEAGVRHILEAAKILEKEEIDFLIIGFGLLESEIKEQINNLNLKNLELITRRLGANELREKMLTAHVNIGQIEAHERLARTIPYKAFESLALKLPYITGGGAGIRELFKDRKNCLMVNLADSKDLAEKIMELKNSPELRKKIAENGYQLYKEKLSPRALGKELLDIILTVAKR